MSAVRCHQIKDGSWVVAVDGDWAPGIYDSAKTAKMAVGLFSDDQIAHLFGPIYRVASGCEGRPVTASDLGRAEAQS